MTLRTVQEALYLLVRLGAPPHLVKHHELVCEAAAELLDGLAIHADAFDRDEVLIGTALHDAGKILHPKELEGPGRHHEQAGKELLLRHGLSSQARFCVTHADWERDGLALEDLLVALADKLWKGKRVEALEQRVIAKLAASADAGVWEVYMTADTVFERVAAGGDRRLARSHLPPKLVE